LYLSDNLGRRLNIITVILLLVANSLSALIILKVDADVAGQTTTIPSAKLKVVTHINNNCEPKSDCSYLTPESFMMHVNTFENDQYREKGTRISRIGIRLDGNLFSISRGHAV
jgi:hypothetical protein